MTAKVSSTYGQFCPLAMAAELLCNRWTMLIVRELLEGSTTFNDLSRGVPLMSRNLLARRLKELEASGAVVCHAGPRGAKGSYRLTAAGEALGAVVRAMASWGQEWVDVEIAADLRTMTAIWMGWEDFAKAQQEGRLSIRGDRKLVQRAKEWLGLSKACRYPQAAGGTQGVSREGCGNVGGSVYV